LGEFQSIALKEGQMAFSYCGVPIIYQSGASYQLTIFYANGEQESSTEASLSLELSQGIFSRSGQINRIELSF